MKIKYLFTLSLLSLFCVPLAFSADSKHLPATEPLDWTGDIASRLVDAADKFLLNETDRSAARRSSFWKPDYSSTTTYDRSLEPNRNRFAQIIGVREERQHFDGFELLSTTEHPAQVGSTETFKAFAVRWPAFADVHGEGLLLVPSRAPIASIIAIPDADQTPEQLAGLTDGIPVGSQFARRLAENGCTVLIPALIDRGTTYKKLSNREVIYRSAFELGRHLIGYEVEKVLAAVDELSKGDATNATVNRQPAIVNHPVGVIGWGEGALIAFYAAALDPRIQSVCVSGYFEDRNAVWQEPIYRNVFGLLEQFGDAEIAALIGLRTLVVEAARGPEVVVPIGTGGGPGRLRTPPIESVKAEFARAERLTTNLNPPPPRALIVSEGGAGPFGTDQALAAFLRGLGITNAIEPAGPAPKSTVASQPLQERASRQLHELDRHNQRLLLESPAVRKKFFAKLDTSSPEKFSNTVEWYRNYFRHEVVGAFDYPLSDPHPRSRIAYEKPKWTGYEVVLDVLPGVFAYGVLLLPNDLREGERRPVVVCQHGLEGRPQQTIEGDNSAYHDFAARLAEQGFITFAPQNLYIFTDRFRSLQRKANPLKKTLFSIIVPQHQQIVNWLKTLPNVDPERIAFYGLSYGGKTAMRVPPLVTDYCLSICSADFNEWVWKNASTLSPYSYAFMGEYEIFEFDLGSTFNYAEMAALIAPRPFMVERGHFDGVAPDEMVAYEFAKVRFLYEAQLKLTDQCRIEWFVGPHTINGKGTFNFLHEKLHWPK